MDKGLENCRGIGEAKLHHQVFEVSEGGMHGVRLTGLEGLGWEVPQ